MTLPEKRSDVLVKNKEKVGHINATLRPPAFVSPQQLFQKRSYRAGKPTGIPQTRAKNNRSL